LSNAIEDSGHTKTEIFHKIDINHNGLIDKSELLDGLKNMGLHVGLIGKVLTVFDRDASGEVSLDEWLSILGEDVAMEEVDVDAPSPIENKPVVNKKAAKKG
jgi:Ca2+-binding EF-hand superfamily protein